MPNVKFAATILESGIVAITGRRDRQRVCETRVLEETNLYETLVYGEVMVG